MFLTLSPSFILCNCRNIFRKKNVLQTFFFPKLNPADVHMDRMTTELADMRSMLSETVGMMRDLKAGEAVRRRRMRKSTNYERDRVGL